MRLPSSPPLACALLHQRARRRRRRTNGTPRRARSTSARSRSRRSRGAARCPSSPNISPINIKAAGWAESDIHVLPYEGDARQPDRGPDRALAGGRPSPKHKPILLMAHMDVVEARREDWSHRPVQAVEKDGYFYGRGTSDIKQGITAVTTALLRLRAEGFKPNRDIVVLFTGDEETRATAPSSARPNGANGPTPSSRSIRTAAAAASRRTGGRSASRSRPPRRPIQMYTFTAATAAATAPSRGPTMPSTSSPTRSSGSRPIASSRC
jgi:hypothetical protein